MSSRHLLDPAYQLLADTTLLPLTHDTLHSRRVLAVQLAAQRSQTASRELDAVRVAERFVRGPTGAPYVRVLVYTPAVDAGLPPVLVHMHGGGLVMGTPEAADLRNRRLAVDVGCVVVSVDYRLAPETRFSGAVEDCYAALKWVDGNADSIGVDRTRIAVGGESAGGGLAAALALLARDRNEIPVQFQLLTYPMLDDRTGSTVDAHPYAGEFVWSSASNRFGWSAALGYEPGINRMSMYLPPARAESLAGLPAAFIAVGTLDLFVEENLAYANRLIAAGVPTELHVYPGAPHGFDAVDAADAAKHCWQASTAALCRALGR
ncbi:alpha/beta hydrolase [Paraburkholderia sp. D1E]|uniref:alpha/beta hydrolase n=1 Tax=Paraburkholderia sp. D1E TaxID=3461398 RepID=UPI004045A6D3